MSDDPTKVNAVDDEAALDAELAASIESVKAGQTIEAKPQGQTEEPIPAGATGEAAPTGETGSTEEAPSNPQADGATGEAEFRIPNKGKFESDEAFEKRVELFDLVKKRKSATTPEAKAALSDQIKTAKGELKTLGSSERFTQSKTGGATEPKDTTNGTWEVDPNLAADQARLKALGGATEEDVRQIIQQTQHDAEVRSDVKSFVGKHAELADEDVREVFFAFVESNYNWEGKAGRELATTLEMAFENMFRPSESVQDRVLKAANVHEKVNAMQFPGGTGSKTTFSPDMQKSIDELKATGLSEETAAELLSE